MSGGRDRSEASRVLTVSHGRRRCAHRGRHDPNVFALLYEHYVQSVYAYCLRRMRTREAAEDATTQVFCQALAGLDRLAHGSFRAWLFAIAHNVVTDLARRQQSFAPLEAAGDPTDAAATPEESALERESGARVADLLTFLPADQRQVLELRDARCSQQSVTATPAQNSAPVSRMGQCLRCLPTCLLRWIGVPAAESPTLDAYRSLLTTYLRPHARLVWWLVALLLAGIVVQVASPLLVGRFVDGALGGAPQSMLLLIGGLFLLASIAQQALLVGATYFGERVAWSATNSLREDLAAHCLSMDAPFHERHTPGELIERVDSDVTAVANFFSQFVIQVLGNVLLLLGILIILCVFDARVGGLLTLFAALALLLMLKTGAIAARYWVDFREMSARLFGFIEEHLNGLEDLRTSGAEAYALSTLGRHASARVCAARVARLLSGVPWSMPILLSAIGTALIYGLSAFLVGAGALTIGAAFTLYFYVRLLFIPLNRISSQLEDFQRASAGIVRIQQVRSWQSALAEPVESVSLPDGPLSVEFDHVHFAYHPGEPVLSDLSFTLTAGARLALIGRTGSGKTTITRLLARLWDADSGVVRVSGVDVRKVRREALRTRIGVVSQQPQLFRGSVRENLTLFDLSIADAMILRALEELQIAEWVQRLPSGLDTLVGADGRGLSAGEAQLLGLARVFLRDPGLVILDEPSSRLDPATERMVNAALARLLEHRTGVIVAHRLDALDHVDSVLVIEAGRLLECGLRGNLASDPASHFARLLRARLDAAPVPV